MAIGAVVIPTGTGDVVAVPASWQLRLCGWSVSEDAGNIASLTIKHGSDATGDPLVAPINCAANGFGMWGISNQGIPAPNGIFIDRTGGQTTVVLYIDKI